MKMTMHIDEALLARVMKANSLESKTETIAYALSELDRRARLRAFATKGLGLSKAELASSIAEGYDLEAMRVAEGRVSYGNKPVKKPAHGKRGAR
jgi:Arc/MetJ family transcription regulator